MVLCPWAIPQLSPLSSSSSSFYLKHQHPLRSHSLLDRYLSDSPDMIQLYETNRAVLHLPSHGVTEIFHIKTAHWRRSSTIFYWRANQALVLRFISVCRSVWIFNGVFSVPFLLKTAVKFLVYERKRWMHICFQSSVSSMTAHIRIQRHVQHENRVINQRK